MLPGSKFTRRIKRGLTRIGTAENEVDIDRNSGKTLVRVNPRFYRPAEVELLIGNPEKARRGNKGVGIKGSDPLKFRHQL